MNPALKGPLVVVPATASALLFGFAFVAAPHACEWGLSAYTLAAAAFALVLFIFSLWTGREVPTPWRFLRGLGYAALVVGVWVGGLFAADIQIMCRLF